MLVHFIEVILSTVQSINEFTSALSSTSSSNNNSSSSVPDARSSPNMINNKPTNANVSIYIFYNNMCCKFKLYSYVFTHLTQTHTHTHTHIYTIQNSNDKKAITTSTPPGRSRALTSAMSQLATPSNHLIVSVKIENPVIILIEDPTERASGGLLAGMTALICFNQDTEALGLSSRESLQVSANSLNLSILKNVEVKIILFFVSQ